MRYEIQVRYFSAIIGWRFCVLENNQMVHHYATRREAQECLEQLKVVTTRPFNLFADELVVIREGCNPEHLQRVREALKMTS